MPHELSVEFSTSLYRLSAIKKAAYRLTGRCGVLLTDEGSDVIRVTLIQATPSDELDRLKIELQNEVLDQDLRELVACETEALRNLLLAQAFSNISLTDPIAENADYHDDPLGIGEADLNKS